MQAESRLPSACKGDAGSGDESDGVALPVSPLGPAARRNRGRSEGLPLDRPGTAALAATVICICNDPYAPALRDLRPLAQVMF